jgi:hypothetical protein
MDVRRVYTASAKARRSLNDQPPPEWPEVRRPDQFYAPLIYDGDTESKPEED